MVDADTVRQNVKDLMVRVLAGGESDLATALVHPDFVNHEADPERRNGPAGAVATGEWLRSCFGDVSYEVHRVLVDGDMAAAYVTMSGTHEGGLPPGDPVCGRWPRPRTLGCPRRSGVGDAGRAPAAASGRPH